MGSTTRLKPYPRLALYLFLIQLQRGWIWNLFSSNLTVVHVSRNHIAVAADDIRTVEGMDFSSKGMDFFLTLEWLGKAPPMTMLKTQFAATHKNPVSCISFSRNGKGFRVFPRLQENFLSSIADSRRLHGFWCTRWSNKNMQHRANA